jgi:DNA-binding PucR family transcriptional regulator
VRHVLGRLLEADPRGSLMDTLEALLRHGSVKEAAAGLGLHRHTVLYRIEKLRDLVGDLDDPATRHRLQLARDLRRLL